MFQHAFYGSLPCLILHWDAEGYFIEFVAIGTNGKIQRYSNPCRRWESKEKVKI